MDSAAVQKAVTDAAPSAGRTRRHRSSTIGTERASQAAEKMGTIRQGILPAARHPHAWTTGTSGGYSGTAWNVKGPRRKAASIARAFANRTALTPQKKRKSAEVAEEVAR